MGVMDVGVHTRDSCSWFTYRTCMHVSGWCNGFHARIPTHTLLYVLGVFVGRGGTKDVDETLC